MLTIANGLRHAGLVPASKVPRAPAREVDCTPERVRGDDVCGAVEVQKLLGISLEGSVG
ncbi:MAG: hypothetical protein ABIS14_15055 [Sphingomonas sp.]